MFELIDHDDHEQRKEYRDFMLPMIDQGIRSTIHAVWMALPAEKRTVDELEKHVRRVVDRAMRDLREDAAAFGLP